MKQELVKLIIQVAEEMNATATQDRQIDVDKGSEAPLYGKDGTLDSLGLVSLVVTVEEAIEDQYDALVVLADEKAMSQRSSPFLTIGTLAQYAATLIEEENASA